MPWLALWEYQHKHEGKLPDDVDAASELGQIANSILATSDVNRQVLTSVPLDLIECALSNLLVWGFIMTYFSSTMSISAAHEFSPTCAVVGGILAQDILKALAAREAPIANFFTFDGNTGGGSVCKMNM